jgi:hypothetical protein
MVINCRFGGMIVNLKEISEELQHNQIACIYEKINDNKEDILVIEEFSIGGLRLHTKDSKLYVYIPAFNPKLVSLVLLHNIPKNHVQDVFNCSGGQLLAMRIICDSSCNEINVHMVTAEGTPVEIICKLELYNVQSCTQILQSLRKLAIFDWLIPCAIQDTLTLYSESIQKPTEKKTGQNHVEGYQ